MMHLPTTTTTTTTTTPTASPPTTPTTEQQPPASYDDQMAAITMSPVSTSSPTGAMKRRHSPSLSIDLSTLPALSQPATPSNTLLITNLNAPEIFQGASLESIRAAINQHATIHTFSPLKSFRRIIVSFYTVEDAINLRQVLDGESVLGNRVRVYFGTETKINDQEDQHLQAPQSQKLFFISPPPSPPVGWEVRNEEPPNKEVHADDLAVALSKLHARPAADQALYDDVEGKTPVSAGGGRSRSSTLVFDPQEHGRSPDLPAIAVEDTTDSPLPLSPVDGSTKQFIHTARPPVELMEQ